MTEIAKLLLFKGKAYRVDIPNWGIPSDATVADIIVFELEELGNDNNVPAGLMAELTGYHHSDAVWVTKTRRDAREYLSEGMSDRDILKIISLDGGRVITEDGCKGYLVLRPEVIKK